MRTVADLVWTLPVTWDDLRAIQTQVPTVRWAAPTLGTTAQVMSEDQNWTTRITGTTPEYFDIRRWSLEAGTPFTQSDMDLGAGSPFGAGVRERLRRVDRHDASGAEQVDQRTRQRARATADVECAVPRRHTGGSDQLGGEPGPVAPDQEVVDLARDFEAHRRYSRRRARWGQGRPF